MERELFERRLREAAAAARDFARKFIEEKLPDPILYRVCLDGSSFHQAERYNLCTEREVMKALWRGGRVPAWIDVAAIGETGEATLLRLLCCERFTSDERFLKHAREGRAPFHVTGPSLPEEYQPGQKFSIFYNSECWTLDDVGHLRSHAHKVWSLDLVGQAFGDEALIDLPNLSRMELLELKASPISGRGLAELIRFPKLRVLRVGLDGTESFRIPKLSSKLSALEVFDISNPPRHPWGFQDLVGSAPNLNELKFESRGELFVDGDCPSAIGSLQIRATRIVGGLRLPKRIDAIYADLCEMGDSNIDAWLAPVEQVGGLCFAGTPITDTFAEQLPARFGLSYLNVVNTNVSEAALQRIRSAHPELKLLPSRSTRT